MKPKIVHKALQTFTARMGIKTNWKEVRTKIKGTGPEGYVRFQIGKHVIEIPAEVKTKVIAAHLPQLNAIKQKLGKLLVLGGVIMPRVQQQLKELGIFFIDAAGNTFIQQDGVFIQVEGKKTDIGRTTDARAFSKGGLKVIFQLFLHEHLINTPIREIAYRTEVSLDTVHKTLIALKAMEYLIAVNKNELTWNNKEELLTTWMNEYDRRLKPALFISRFDFLHDKDFIRWKQIKFRTENTCWGGEPAGELLTNNLKPAELMIYTSETEMELVKNYRMVPRKAGAIVVYKRFWPTQEKEPKFAPPLLVYADLVNTGERRNIEIAKKIFNEYLKNKFQTA